MKTGRGRGLAGAGQRDADIGVLRFARAVDDAAHHGDVQRLDARDTCVFQSGISVTM